VGETSTTMTATATHRPLIIRRRSLFPIILVLLTYKHRLKIGRTLPKVAKKQLLENLVKLQMAIRAVCRLCSPLSPTQQKNEHDCEYSREGDQTDD
jgi:hypothetical protein